MPLRPLALLASAFVAGCAHIDATSSADDQDAPAWSTPPFEQRLSVRDGRSGERLSFSALLDQLEQADAVFLGETHIDETTHDVEYRIYDELLARRDERVVLAMEMFERDVQPVLDDYIAGEIDEEQFLLHARPWGNYAAAYRPMIERARAGGLRVVASNFPHPLVRRIGMEGPEVLDGLDEAERAQAPAEFFPNSPEYWRRVDNAIRGHIGMMPPSEDATRLYSTQSLWDNSMGAACAEALDAAPGHMVVHVNGGFHSEYWDGTAHQFALRRPDAAFKTVAIVPSSHPAVARVDGAPIADYVVFAESRAADVNDDRHSVSVSRSLDYELHLPANASADQPAPLLLWLSDDGLGIADGMALWRERLGEQVAIAVIESPYRELLPDLAEGGRWFWPDDFSSDVGVMQAAIERTWGYLLRRYPIDPTRVCLAGEGTGATVVAAVSLFTDRMAMNAVALSPRRYAKLKDFPLPLPEYRGDDPMPDKALVVLGAPAHHDWWSSELEAYVDTGFDARWVDGTEDAWKRELQRENLVRDALGLDRHQADDTAPRRHLVVDVDSGRARHWARLIALRELHREGALLAVLDEDPAGPGSEPLALSLDPGALAKSNALPLCPGPFGGTTVLVLSADVDEATRAAWYGLEDDDPLSQRSRFHRTRVATLDDDRPLVDVLRTLHSENRRNVLVIPVAFCADSATMRAMQRSVRELEDVMTLQWQPGLGATLAR